MSKPFPFSVCEKCCATGNVVIEGETGTLIIDGELSETSENPVQNKVIYAVVKELDENKADVSHTHSIDDLDESINSIIDGIIMDGINWEVGSIVVNTGTNGSLTTRARTMDFLEYENYTVITSSGDVQIIPIFYDANKKFISGSSTSWLTGTIHLSDLAPEGAAYFRLTARYMPEGSTNGEELTSENINLISDNVKIEIYRENTIASTVYNLDRRVDKAIKTNNHFYKTIDFSEITNNTVTLDTNCVTYISGTTKLDTLTISFDTTLEVINMAQETVLVLDLTKYTTAPTIVFDGTIKWINAEVPTITNGNVYMISFTHVRDSAGTINYSLAVGGEFA
ncbi:MAG: hypothetical protein E7398_00295 [Ruminococcaceae bacterium]|nr:hypothetical protein [Oscillospiraceae bacterium]